MVQSNTDTSATPVGIHLTGSSNAGGSEFISGVGFSGLVSSFRKWAGEQDTRLDASYFSTRGMDHQHKPPKWMEHKDVAVDGTPLSPEERRADGYWRTVYQRELAIGDAIAETRKKKRFEQLHSMWGSLSNFLRGVHLQEPLDERRAIAQSLKALELEARDDEKAQQSAMAGDKAKRVEGLQAAWEAVMESIETNRPLARVAQEYRPKVDFYGVDPFLDSAPSLIWFLTKVGLFVGLGVGTARTMSVVNVDAQFLRASGIGILSLLNVTVFANALKWGGNLGLFGCAFCVGDRLATFGKSYVYHQYDRRSRSTANYVVGLGLGFSIVGTLPWWVLNDFRYGVRLGAAGMLTGAVLGAFVGTVLERLVSLNIFRLDASNRDLRRYEALMKRESAWLEKERLKQLTGDTRGYFF